MRYPGGNFASGYHWRDGVGPADERPTVRELAWQSIETEPVRHRRVPGALRAHRVGADAGGQPRHRDPRGGARLGRVLQRTRRDPGRRPAGRRTVTPSRTASGCGASATRWTARGSSATYPPDDYAIRAQQAAKMMKDVDPAIETVVCGSSATTPADATRTGTGEVLEYLGDAADYISLHRYVDNHADDTPDFLAVGRVDRPPDRGASTRCAAPCGPNGVGRKRPYLCFDEWNVWYKNLEMDGRGPARPAPDRGDLQPRGRAGRRPVPQQLHPPRRRREDREPRPGRERDRPAAHPRRRPARADRSSTRCG